MDPDGGDQERASNAAEGGSNRARGRVVFLFGTSSVGKTSTATELQAVLDEPYLLLGLDTFFGAWPDRWGNGGRSERDGFRYERGVDGSLAIRCGEHGERLLAGIRAAVHSLAASGTNVIYDELPIDARVLPAWREALSDLDVTWVRLVGDRSDLEQREAERWKPAYRGLSRGHAHLVDDASWADLTLDSTLMPSERADQIRRFLDR